MTTTTTTEGLAAEGTPTAPVWAPDVLDRAADIIERDGHAKGEWCASGNASCLGGAIVRAAAGDPGEPLDLAYYPPTGAAAVALYTLAESLGLTLAAYPSSRPVDRVMDWNDEPTRTKAQVVTALRSAAAGAREAV